MSLVRRRFPALAVLAAVGAIVLAGCAPVEPSTASTPAVSSEPAAADVTVPLIRIPTTCGQLADSAVIESWFQAPAIVRSDESTALDGVGSAAYREAGGLHCWWSTAVSGFDGSGVNISLLPDAALGFAKQQADEVPSAYLKQNTAGDGSSYSCGSYDTLWSCTASMLVGQVWADVWISVGTSSALDETVAGQRIQSLLVRLSAVLRNAQPEGTSWSVPSEAFTGVSLCDPAVAVPWLQQVGVGTPAGTGSDFGYQSAFVNTFAQMEECNWYDESGGAVGVSTVTLPGGAWVFEPSVSLTPVWGSVALTEIVDVEGMDATRLGCDASGCAALVSAGGSLISVGTYGLNRDQLIAALETMPTGGA